MGKPANDPTRELRRLAIRIEAGCDRFAQARGTSWLRSKWEAPRHAWTLSNLSLRHAEATALLAKTDAALIAAGWVTARAAVEAAARCLWVLEPTDVWEREARWLALLYEGARLGQRPEIAGTQLEAASSQLESFADDVRSRLPAGVTVPRMSSTMAILKEQGTDLAWFYVLSSQFTHAAELATRTTRKNLGDLADYGDVSDSGDWYAPVWAAWQAFRATALRLIEVSGGESTEELERYDVSIAEARAAYLDSSSRSHT